ncbi:protein-disulfide reductase DsbD N-terminal domain-containing protein [Parvicella tangerina]|uniref:Thiol:disulfide interchange protein DsbD N-terminal domain-containing protein n=1 Tax=Parvicella tangerina TaxID=2829795 RepID=A0A916JJT0_9FLAO|nr:protein-disulfide reductase DsbD N-terminal domain-containing protein [Parvicella tangerina]CAG5076514.1 hypothetical protein CRYO30217_00126 [Parvicella tangerina]
MKKIHTLFLFLFFLSCGTASYSQHNPVSFQTSTHGDTLVFDAHIESGWHLYAANLPDPTGGPLPTEIVYDDPAPELIGGILEPKGHVEMDESFGVEVKYFENKTYYKQVLASTAKEHITGTIYYMVCNDEMCIPLEYKFSVNP